MALTGGLDDGGLTDAGYHKEIAVSQEEIKQQLTEQKVLHISGLSDGWSAGLRPV